MTVDDFRRAIKEASLEEVVKWGGRISYERKLLRLLKWGHNTKRYRNRRQDKTEWRAYDCGYYYRDRPWSDVEREWLQNRISNRYLINLEIARCKEAPTIAVVSNVIPFPIRKRCRDAA
jgi:hypothetical protein